MVEVAMPMSMVSFGPVVGPGMSSDGCGYSSSLQFTGMMATFEKTGSIAKTAEEAAKDAITLAEEFFKKQTIIPYGYEIVNGKWTSGGKALDELGFGERIERVIRVEDGMFRDVSITQALTVSEDTGSGRSYIYLFSRDKDSKDKISALAIEYDGSTNELSALLENLSGSSHDFSQPLFFGEGKEISVNDFFQAAYDSYGTEERRSQMSSYLARLGRDVSDFPNLVVDHQKQVDELARKIEEDLMSNPDVVVGLSAAVNGLNKIVEGWISQGPEPIFNVTRTPMVESASWRTTPLPPELSKVPAVMSKTKETESEDDKDVAVGLFVQTLVSTLEDEEYEEEIVNIREDYEEMMQSSTVELSIETIVDTIEPMVPVIEIILLQLAEVDLGREDIGSLILLMLSPAQETDVTQIPEFVQADTTLFEDRQILSESEPKNLQAKAKSKVTMETTEESEILEELLEMVLTESDISDKSEMDFDTSFALFELAHMEGVTSSHLPGGRMVYPVRNSWKVKFTSEVLFVEDEPLTNIGLLLEVIRDEGTTTEMKEMIVFFLFHELVKIYENRELIEPVFNNPIFKRRYEKFILCIEKLFSLELLNDDGFRDFSILELLEFMKARQYTIPKKKNNKFPPRGVIYQYLYQLTPSEL